MSFVHQRGADGQSGPTGRSTVSKDEQLAAIDERRRRAVLKRVQEQQEETDMIERARKHVIAEQLADLQRERQIYKSLVTDWDRVTKEKREEREKQRKITLCRCENCSLPNIGVRQIKTPNDNTAQTSNLKVIDSTANATVDKAQNYSCQVIDSGLDRQLMTGDSAATSSARKPTASTRNPSASTRNPSASTRNPTASTRNPTASTRNPTASTRNPTTSTRNPTASTRNPTTSTRNPTVSTDYPSVSTGFPTASSRNPTGRTKKLEFASEVTSLRTPLDSTAPNSAFQGPSSYQGPGSYNSGMGETGSYMTSPGIDTEQPSVVQYIAGDSDNVLQFGSDNCSPEYNSQQNSDLSI